MNSDTVVLVDENDTQMGCMDKHKAHSGKGILHRAVSVLLYRKLHGTFEVLIQQRSKEKLLWPLFWSNTICTHPVDGELPLSCAVRRLYEEMGIHINSENLRFVFTLRYHAQYNEALGEHEIDHVFVGEWNGTLIVNAHEVNNALWISWTELILDMEKNKNKYSPWFHLLVQNTRIQELFHKA